MTVQLKFTNLPDTSIETRQKAIINLMILLSEIEQEDILNCKENEKNGFYLKIKTKQHD